MPKRTDRKERDVAVVEEAPEKKIELSEAPAPEKDLGEPVAWGSGGQFINRNGKLYRA